MNALIPIGILIAGIIVSILAIGIIEFGSLIARAPDMLDRHGKRLTSTNKPHEHALLFAEGFIILFIIGAGILWAYDTKAGLITGSIFILSSLMFSITILLFEMKIYELMKNNERELKGSLVA